jgi:hypothetical protein
MPSRHSSRTNSSSNHAQLVQTSEGSACAPDMVQLAHNLRNKVGTILAHCELINLENPAASRNVEHLRAIQKAAHLIGDMVGSAQTICGELAGKPPLRSGRN